MKNNKKLLPEEISDLIEKMYNRYEEQANTYSFQFANWVKDVIFIDTLGYSYSQLDFFNEGYELWEMSEHNFDL